MTIVIENVSLIFMIHVVMFMTSSCHFMSTQVKFYRFTFQVYLHTLINEDFSVMKFLLLKCHLNFWNKLDTLGIENYL